jgi:trehalose 6-phosphate synthase
MRRAARFALALVLGLALVTGVASLLVQRTARDWFERDLGLRAQLAVNGARRALLAQWQNDTPGALSSTLTELTFDERIMASAACTRDQVMIAHTKGFPAELSCAQLAPRVLGESGNMRAWADILRVPGQGEVHISATPIAGPDGAPGFVVLVQDLAFIERRERKTQEFIFLVFGFLALAASAVTAVAARLSWRSWSEELRRLIRSGKQAPQPEFQPLLRDVRDLVDRVASERDSDREGGAWNAERLKQTIERHLQGEKMVLLANREPYLHERVNDAITVVHPASGLVSALEPVMRACSGTWVAHGSGSADRETVDRHDRVRVPPGEESYALRRVWLTAEEEKGYYYGFANEGLWPLCHLAHNRPIFRSDDWRCYQTVNKRFADAVIKEVSSADPIVLVQDYHFALAPRLIRARNGRATILMFWHIPWPSSQHFGICPWRKEILQGMLGASILGFHTQFDCNNFLDSVDRFLEARIDRERNAVIQRGHTTLVRPYPISIEWPNRWLEGLPPADECRSQVLQELGLKPDALIGLGVDRLDYTKGLEERLLTVERLLEREPQYRGRFSFVQLAAPSRTIIERYKQLNENVEQVAARINERFGANGYRPVILLRAHHEPPKVFKYYRAADLCYVSSLHDGMNLVAKEFVSAREDERGVLILSQFTGAARELTESLVVNPYDLDESSAAMSRALSMSGEEQRMRMRSMRSFVSEFNVYRWAGRMLVDAARLRSRERLSGRLSQRFLPRPRSEAAQ